MEQALFVRHAKLVSLVLLDLMMQEIVQIVLCRRFVKEVSG